MEELGGEPIQGDPRTSNRLERILFSLIAMTRVGIISAVLCGMVAVDPVAIGALTPDSYEVFAIPKEYPDDGPRTVEADPALQGGNASPFGWHDTDGSPGAEFTITRGNNVFAYTDVDGDNAPDPGGAPDGGPGLEFLFPLDLGEEPAAYRPAAVTNAFYWFNVMHDVFYGYGFDEEAGNFQVNNYGGAGVGGDPILVEVQEGTFTNGATFTAPPDGESPRIQLAVWTLTDPHRDSALSTWINAFSFGRVMAARLVGGPQNTACLIADEASGVWSGWCDWLPLVLTADPTDGPGTSRGVGTYVLGQPPDTDGVRAAPYSTDFDVNDLTYGSIGALPVPFGTGTVWATILWQVYWELVAAHGFNPEIYGDWTTGGNNLALQLVIDGMKLVPCQPGFVDARDAILQADADLTGGANRCELWNGFAIRGLGVGASQGSSNSVTDGSESFDLPEDCQSSGAPSERAPFAGSPLVRGTGFPNPFDLTTSLRFTLRRAQHVRLSVHDPAGREVAVLSDEPRSAGDHMVSWDGRGAVGSGVYFIRIQTEEGTVSRRVQLIR